MRAGLVVKHNLQSSYRRIPFCRRIGNIADKEHLYIDTRAALLRLYWFLGVFFGPIGRLHLGWVWRRGGDQPDSLPERFGTALRNPLLRHDYPILH